jgi:hypothetical protein
MIRVLLAPEPATFDATVRQPGLSAVAELVGEPPTVKRPGPKRKKIAERREHIPAADFPPFWTKAHDDLLKAYERRCAYLACYIEPANGVATTDHMVPKSQTWDAVYEWANYRLAGHLINTLKSDQSVFLDPFEIEDDWFGLEMVDFDVYVRDGFPEHLRAHAANTIPKLNHRECRELRGEYVESYLRHGVPLAQIARRAPFVARELRRQGLLLPKDK